MVQDIEVDLLLRLLPLGDPGRDAAVLIIDLGKDERGHIIQEAGVVIIAYRVLELLHHDDDPLEVQQAPLPGNGDGIVRKGSDIGVLLVGQHILQRKRAARLKMKPVEAACRSLESLADIIGGGKGGSSRKLFGGTVYFWPA